MLDEKGFDLWADSFEETVAKIEREDAYPFAGYSKVLSYIYQKIRKHSSYKKILDIGFGTAAISSKLYQEGYQIFGVDFSKRMLEIAQEKMPESSLFTYDLTRGLPKELSEETFDCVVSTYALHHLNDEQKADLFSRLLSLLAKDGMILVGDVAFATRTEMEDCSRKFPDIWDSQEHYFVFEELQSRISAQVTFTPISFCGGVIMLQPSVT